LTTPLIWQPEVNIELNKYKEFFRFMDKLPKLKEVFKRMKEITKIK